MLRNASVIKGYTIAATDGRIGTVSDILFDDSSWRVRWVVVDTGNWLPGRTVLLPLSALGRLDENGSEFAVKLTMQQIKDSPGSDTDRPVSRQIESNIYSYYGWQPYWGTDMLMGGGLGYGTGFGGGVASALPIIGSRRASDIAIAGASDDDPHLRSVQAVKGYHIHATDGEIGHLTDFIVDDTDWSIRSIIVDTKNWWPGKIVVIAPSSIDTVDWMDSLVNLKISREKVKASPAYDASTTIDRAMMETFP
jgi:sporulation protein YlmC with PRC-barrel domain